MGKGRIVHFGFGGVSELFEAEPVQFRKKSVEVENHLRNIAIHEGLASLSSPMVGQTWKALIILKKQYLKTNQWNAYKNLRHSSYESYLNPQVADHSTETIQQWQQCCGYPGLRLLVPRAKKILINYREQFKFLEKKGELQDFQARVFQHEVDHIECIDPLKTATRIQIIEDHLKSKHDDHIQALFASMFQQRQKSEDKSSVTYRRSRQFNELRRQIAYCITEHYRK